MSTETQIPADGVNAKLLPALRSLLQMALRRGKLVAVETAVLDSVRVHSGDSVAESLHRDGRDHASCLRKAGLQAPPCWRSWATWERWLQWVVAHLA